MQNIVFDNFNSKYYDISKRIEVKDLSKYSQLYQKIPENSFYFARIIYDSDSFTTEYIDEKMNVITFSKDWLKSYGMVDDMAFVVKKDWKQVVINQKGEEIISYVFDSGTNASEGVLLYKKADNNKYGFINKQGKNIFAEEFDYAESFYNHFATIIYKNEDALLDKEGNVYLVKDLINGNKNVYKNVLVKE